MNSQSVEQLVADFRDAAIRKGSEGSLDDHQLYFRMSAAYHSLQSLGATGAIAFSNMVDDDNPSVRSWVAATLLSNGDDRGIPVLIKIAEFSGMIGFNAKMVLQEYEKGRLEHPFPTKNMA